MFDHQEQLCLKVQYVMSTASRLSIKTKHKTDVCLLERSSSCISGPLICENQWQTFTLRTGKLYCAVPLSDFLSSSICSVQLDAAAVYSQQ